MYLFIFISDAHHFACAHHSACAHLMRNEIKWVREPTISASSEIDSDDEDVCTSLVRGDCRSSRHSRRGGVSSNLEEGTVQNLVQLFLMHVHVKNPILEVETLRSYARQIDEDGPSWDGKSCLVVRLHFYLSSLL